MDSTRSTTEHQRVTRQEDPAQQTPRDQHRAHRAAAWQRDPRSKG